MVSFSKPTEYHPSSTHDIYGHRYQLPVLGTTQKVSHPHGPWTSTYDPDMGNFVLDQYNLIKSANIATSAATHANTYGQTQNAVPSNLASTQIDPLRAAYRYQTNDDYLRGKQHEKHAFRQSTVKEEKAIGGVSATLDYDMEEMTTFVAEMTVGMYDLLASRICIADIDFMRSIKPGTVYPSAFRKWVLQVLNATRLPSATILLSLSYMALRIRKLSAENVVLLPDRTFYQMLTVSLILGSKFLDDNTFQNKSWADVSNISVTELNRDERQWLASFDHRLHNDPNSWEGFTSWQVQWELFKDREAVLAPRQVLRGLDTNVRRQRSVQTLSPYSSAYSKATSSSYSLNAGTERQYPTPTYSSYDPWFGSRSAVDRSPSTAPHSGPRTPEYMGLRGCAPIDYLTLPSAYSGPLTPDYTGSSGSCSQADVYPLRLAYGYNAVPCMAPYLTAYNSGYEPLDSSHVGTNHWNCHGSSCQCGSCRHNQSYPIRFESLAVV